MPQTDCAEDIIANSNAKANGNGNLNDPSPLNASSLSLLFVDQGDDDALLSLMQYTASPHQLASLQHTMEIQQKQQEIQQQEKQQQQHHKHARGVLSHEQEKEREETLERGIKSIATAIKSSAADGLTGANVINNRNEFGENRFEFFKII